MAELKTLLRGLALGESPCWHENRLWFSDWVAQELIAVGLDGKSEVLVRVPTMPFCFDWLGEGHLGIVSGREGLVLHQESVRSLVTHSDLTHLATTHFKKPLSASNGAG